MQIAKLLAAKRSKYAQQFRTCSGWQPMMCVRALEAQRFQRVWLNIADRATDLKSICVLCCISRRTGSCGSTLAGRNIILFTDAPAPPPQSQRKREHISYQSENIIHHFFLSAKWARLIAYSRRITNAHENSKNKKKSSHAACYPNVIESYYNSHSHIPQRERILMLPFPLAVLPSLTSGDHNNDFVFGMSKSNTLATLTQCEIVTST